MTTTTKIVSSKRRALVAVPPLVADSTAAIQAGIAGAGQNIPKALKDRGDGFTSIGNVPGAGKANLVAVAEYDFTEDGAFTLGPWGSGVCVPANAVVTNAGMYQDVVPTGLTNIGANLKGAQVAATVYADYNLVASASVTATIGLSVIGVPVPATASTWLHTGDRPREIELFTTGSALTAGKVYVWAQYFIIDQATPGVCAV